MIRSILISHCAKPLAPMAEAAVLGQVAGMKILLIHRSTTGWPFNGHNAPVNIICIISSHFYTVYPEIFAVIVPFRIFVDKILQMRVS